MVIQLNITEKHIGNITIKKINKERKKERKKAK